MIKDIVFNGGLGNQMFQYAFYLRLRRTYPFDIFVFDIELSQGCHNGYELDKIFNTDGLKKAKNFRRIRNHFPKLLENPFIVKQRISLEYTPKVFQERHFFVIYDGYWQSELFFRDVVFVVKKAFRFNESLMNNPTRLLANKMLSGNFVSVHIRRGDYVKQKDIFGLCGEEYYNRSIAMIKEKVDYPKFVFFSDDIDWVKEMFNEEDSIYVDWNHGKDSWQDMYLMTQCKHNIIANSSFSWWGAWLNSNKEKIVIAPKKWFEFTSNYDIIPKEWFTL